MEPIGDLPLLRVKIRTDQNKPFPELMIFLIVFHIAYLRKRGIRILIQLEFKNVDPVAACGNGVNSSAVCAGFGFNIDSKQEKERIIWFDNTSRSGFEYRMELRQKKFEALP